MGLKFKLRVLLATYYDRKVISNSITSLKSFAEVVDANQGRCLTKEELFNSLPGVHVTIAADEKYTPEVLDCAGELFLIARDGTGYDGVDVQAATERGILVTRAPIMHQATANLTIGLMITLVRKIIICDRGIRQNLWTNRGLWLCPDLTGMTLGIVGFGQVGREVAKRALAMGMKILAYDIADIRSTTKKIGITVTSIEEILRNSDVVSVHMNAGPSNVGMFNRDLFLKMKKGAYFINCSRGSIVDDAALLEALNSGHIAGAALDVYSTEPPRENHPLFALENVLCTPHVAGDTTTTMEQAIQMNVEQIQQLLKGEQPSHLLNPEVWEKARIHRLFDRNHKKAAEA